MDVDYDVMVFVRFKQGVIPMPDWSRFDVLFSSLNYYGLIVPKSYYIEIKNNLIKKGSDFISEIQLIKPKRP